MLRELLQSRKPSAPGPKGIDLLLGLRALQHDPLAFVTELQRRHGDVVKIRLGPQDIFLVTHPAVIEHTCKNHRVYVRGSIGDRARELIGNSLIVSDGDVWIRQRRLLQPAFRQEVLSTYVAAADEATASMIDRWDEHAAAGRSIDIAADLARLMLDVTCRALFGVPLAQQSEAVARNLTEVLDLTVRRAREVLPLPLWVPTERHRSFRRARQDLDRMIAELCDRAQDGPGNRRAMVDILRESRDEQGPMDAPQLREEVFGLLFSGYESPVRALTWTLYLLARHREHYERVRDEARALGDARFDMGALARLEHTGAVFQESMRLYPPGWILGREVVKDDEIGGFPISAGAYVMYSAWVTHRRADLWEQPLAFDPSRFEPERASKISKFAYFPFGVPPHSCIGAGFATMQAKVALAAIARRFRLEVDGGASVEPTAGATVRPRHPIRMRLRPA
ncbi:MAG: cytochrome P450 [Deltaproteobacteria bacterium]|nr:cytochrome P450 [Nannocystaceae bacterium]